MIRTKIIITLGPATADSESILRLLRAGADVCRLNFSHGKLEDHLRMLVRVREAADRCGTPIAILGDLGGPKIRLGLVADEAGTGGMPIAPDQRLVIQRQPITGAAGRVSSTYPQLIDDVKVGDRLLVEDGLLRFTCTDKTRDELICTCAVGGILKSAKGINLPDTAVSVPSITERDWECIDWAIAQDLDYLALSFVRRPEELRRLRQHLSTKGSRIHLIAKIEKVEALSHIDAIIDASDGLMVARGDLGVEMDVATVPITQKDLIRRCHAAAKPVIVATQMLQSMIEQPTPTRAEVSDVANAIFDGGDAVMLSGETSVGKFPVQAVEMMNHIARVTEAYLARSPALQQSLQARAACDPAGAAAATELHLSAAVAHGVWDMVRGVDVKLVVVWSQTGTTARLFSQRRLPVPLIALSDDDRALRRMVLYYGVFPRKMTPAEEMAPLVAQVDEMLAQTRLAGGGDRVIIVAGSSLGGRPGTINGIVIHTVGQHWAPVPAAASIAAVTATGSAARSATDMEPA